MAAVEHDFTIEQGASFYKLVSLKDEQNTAIDLTGRSARAMVRRQFSSTTPVFSFTCAIPTPSNGQITMTVDASVTAALNLGGASVESPAEYVYDLELYYDDSGVEKVDRLLYGKVIVLPEVTK